MPYYLVLGILCGIISLYFSSAVMKTEKIMEGLESQLIRILYGGALLGFILFFFPPIYGEGYDTLNLLIEGNSDQLLDRSPFFSAIQNPYLILFFLAFVILIKPVASALTLSAGGAGGIFAPSLYVGGILGFLVAYGKICSAFIFRFPWLILP
jgi:Chloride channel protein EriC